MIQRSLAGALGALLAADGLAMLIFPLAWYGAVPGVITTGPFNPHFVADIGVAYLTTATALAWFALDPAVAWSALAIGSLFLDAHAAIHVVGAVTSPACGSLILRDLPGVFVPALLASALVLLPPVRQGAPQ
ncbi:MAG: hypothetical protein JO111_05045 [Caulobacteraceae bacterium]|nr:hypothetical protein [Caulobacteraceae bacterium]